MTYQTAWVALGGNLGSDLGDVQTTLRAALKALDSHPQINVSRVSSFYRTAPVDASGPDFTNTVACCQTTLAPLALLHVMQSIELKYGRERPYVHAPRTLDLDLLLYGDCVLNTPELILPHPAMHERTFVLQPFAELDGSVIVPGKGRIADLLQHVDQEQRIERI